jgi:hypothetical protein
MPFAARLEPHVIASFEHLLQPCYRRPPPGMYLVRCKVFAAVHLHQVGVKSDSMMGSLRTACPAEDRYRTLFPKLSRTSSAKGRALFDLVIE